MQKFDNTLMQTALVWSKESYCKRLQVGAVISKDGRIISTGYNGTLSKTKNNCEEFTTDCKEQEKVICEKCNGKGSYFKTSFPSDLLEKCICEDCDGKGKHCSGLKTNEFVIHAEQNALLFAMKNGISTVGATMFVTHSPCPTCAKLIAGAGIIRVCYNKHYRNTDGIEFLEKVGVEVEKIDV